MWFPVWYYTDTSVISVVSRMVLHNRQVGNKYGFRMVLHRHVGNKCGFTCGFPYGLPEWIATHSCALAVSKPG